MKAVVMSIGIPGAGKTTVLAALAKDCLFPVLVTDAVREELGINPADRVANLRVWETVRERVAQHFESNERLIIDSTFTDRVRRTDFISYLRSIGIDKVFGLYLATPLAVAQERNLGRARNVRPEVIRAQHAAITAEPPALEDGFDRIFMAEELPALQEALMLVDSRQKQH